ncbi:Fur-regulated basic protein FbpA [Bacillus songklensis]|uniref:Fur-regulated basic protein FbpA n=1 Tax=Bacillus songklensis TaxID=1069116 RepID=A0ABV8B8K7_9BACI
MMGVNEQSLLIYRLISQGVYKTGDGQHLYELNEKQLRELVDKVEK